MKQKLIEQLEKLTGKKVILKEVKQQSSQDYIQNKKFLDEFISDAEYAYEEFGDFKSLYEVYEELNEETIKEILGFCLDNNLINY